MDPVSCADGVDGDWRIILIWKGITFTSGNLILSDDFINQIMRKLMANCCSSPRYLLLRIEHLLR